MHPFPPLSSFCGPKPPAGQKRDDETDGGGCHEHHTHAGQEQVGTIRHQAGDAMPRATAHDAK